MAPPPAPPAPPVAAVWVPPPAAVNEATVVGTPDAATADWMLAAKVGLEVWTEVAALARPVPIAAIWAWTAAV